MHQQLIFSLQRWKHKEKKNKSIFIRVNDTDFGVAFDGEKEKIMYVYVRVKLLRWLNLFLELYVCKEKYYKKNLE